MCLSLEDPSTGSFLPSTCTHLFSFERAVPYVPQEKELGKEVKEANEAVETAKKVQLPLQKESGSQEVKDQDQEQ